MRTDAPLVVDVAGLLQRPATRRPFVAEIAFEDLKTSGAEVPAGTDVEIDVELESTTDGVVVTGRVSTVWEAPCRRCLGAVRGELRAPVREVFEHDPVEGETYPVEAEHIDLEPVVREAVLLELPLAPLCQEACKGLCSQCGTDLNVAACQCEVDVRDPRWAALDELRFPADDEPMGEDRG